MWTRPRWYCTIVGEKNRINFCDKNYWKFNVSPQFRSKKYKITSKNSLINVFLVVPRSCPNTLKILALILLNQHVFIKIQWKFALKLKPMLICAKTFPKKKFPKNSPSFFCGWKYRGFVTKYLCFILEVAIVQKIATKEIIAWEGWK